MSTGRNHLGDIARETDAAVGDHRYVGALEGLGNIGNRCHLRHADTGDDAGGADGTGTDTDLHGISPCSCEIYRSSSGGDVATDHGDMRIVSLDAAHLIDHELRMAVGSIDDDHVNTRLDDGSDAGRSVGTGADGSGDAQASELIFTGVWIVFRLADVLEGNQTTQFVFVVDHQNLLDSVCVQQLFHFLIAGVFLDRDQPTLRGHDRGHGGFIVGLEAHVATGDDAHQIAAFHHWHTGDVILPHEGDQVADSGCGRDGDGVFDHATFILFDNPDFAGLLLDAHALVNDPKTAFLCHGNRETRLGDRVHRGRNHWDIQGD